MIELSPSFREWSQRSSLNLPQLPRVVRYYDSYSDSYSELEELASNDIWILHYDGKAASLNFGAFPPQLLQLLKSWCAASLPVNSPGTIDSYINRLRIHLTPSLLDLISSGPLELRSSWSVLLGTNAPYSVFSPISSVLHFLCEHSVHPWAPEWDDLISLLPYPKKDKYASVRIGDVFITPTEEQSYVQFLDTVVSRIETQPHALTMEELRTGSSALSSRAWTSESGV